MVVVVVVEGLLVVVVVVVSCLLVVVVVVVVILLVVEVVVVIGIVVVDVVVPATVDVVVVVVVSSSYSNAPKSGALPLYGYPTSIPVLIKSDPAAKCKNVRDGKHPLFCLEPSIPVELRLRKSESETE